MNNKKKNKIKQNNQKDDQLLFETLLSGGTYSDYKSALQDRSMPQEKPQEITEDDVLQAWILGKDEESEQFARGGHMHQSYNSYLTRRDIENSVLNNPMFQQTSYVPDTSISGNLGFTYTDLLGNAKPQGNTDTANNWSGWQANGQYDPSKGAWQGAGNSIMSSTAIAGTLMDWGAGMYDNTVNRVDNASNKIEAGINQVGAQNFGIGDTAYRASQYDNIQRAQNSFIEDNGGMSSSEGVLNGLKSIGQGAATGAQVGGLWGGIIGGVAGLGKGIGEWFLNRDAAERRMELNNLRASIANSQVDQKYDLTNSNSNRLYNFSQLQQPYMAACGGKMKNKLASGGYINSHYDYITDPLVKVNAGGTHQENPNEGVQTSIAPDGQPNLVEEGETIINNGQEDAYVFSDRIVADDEILKSHLLPNKFAGKTYADISKELDKIIEEHKGSEIEERTFQEMIKRLQEAQEDQKYQEKAEEVAKFIDGLSDEQKEQLEQTMVEEAQAEQEHAMAEQQAMQEQAAQEQAAQEQQMQPEQTPEQVVEQPQGQAVPSRYDEMMSRAAITDAANGGMFQIGGIARTIRNSNRQPVHKSWTGLYDMFTRKPELQFSGFGGGEFGKAGASGEWGDVDYIQNTPVPAVTRTFDDAFAEARRNGQSTFLFNGKLYNTEIDPNYNSNAGKYRQEVVSPALNIRKVYDSAGQEMDSTRVEPWAGQMPGWTEREYLDDKKKYTYIGSESEWPDNSSDKKHSKGGHLHQDLYSYMGYPTPNPRFPSIDMKTFIENAPWRNDNPPQYNNPRRNRYVENWGMRRDANTGNPLFDPLVRQNIASEDEQKRNLAKRVNNGYIQGNLTGLSLGSSIGIPYQVLRYSSLGLKPTNDLVSIVYNTADTDNQISKSRAQRDYEKSMQQLQEAIEADGKRKSWSEIGKNKSAKQIYDPTGFPTTPTGQYYYENNFGYDTTSFPTTPTSQYYYGNGQDDIVIPMYNGPAPYISNGNSSQAKPTTPRTGTIPNAGTPLMTTPVGGVDATSYNPTVYNIWDDPLNDVVEEDTDKLVESISNKNNNPEEPAKDNPENPETNHGFNWLRYAPAIGSGLQHISDLLGITNRPDYTNANMYQRSINGIPTINYLPIGSYINYSPIDETYQQNQLRAANNAARRAAIVNAGGNAGAALAALNAIGYNESNALGDLGIRVADYNNQMGQKVAEHNLRINQINASNSLSAQEKNQAIAAEKARLNYNLAQMRQSIEDQNDIARAMNYNNLMTNLGNIGRENYILNQINNNPAYYYRDNGDGTYSYKFGLTKTEKDAAKRYAEENGLTII